MIAKKYIESDKKSLFTTFTKTIANTPGKKTWLACLGVGATELILYNYFLGSVVTNAIASESLLTAATALSIYTMNVLELLTDFTYRPVNFISTIIQNAKQKELTPPEKIPYEQLPQVTITIPCRNEPLDVMKETSLKSVERIHYPKDKLSVLVIDNSSGNEWRLLQTYVESLGYTFIHREGTVGAKARNLNISLSIQPDDDGVYYPKNDGLFFQIDSDIEFDPFLLERTIAEFVHNPKLPYVVFMDGYSQGYSLMSKLHGYNNVFGFTSFYGQRNGYVTLDGHAVLYNPDVIRRMGGWIETGVGEDWLTGVMLRTQDSSIDSGKRVMYSRITNNVPGSFANYKKQQQRWAQGCAEVIRKGLPLFLKAKHIPWNEKRDIIYTMTDYIRTGITSVMLPTVLSIAALFSPFINGSFLMPLFNFWAGYWLISFSLYMIFGLYAFGTRFLKMLPRLILGGYARTGAKIEIVLGTLKGLFTRGGEFFVSQKGKQANTGTATTAFIMQNKKEILFTLSLLAAFIISFPSLLLLGPVIVGYIFSLVSSLIPSYAYKGIGTGTFSFMNRLFYCNSIPVSVRDHALTMKYNNLKPEQTIGFDGTTLANGEAFDITGKKEIVLTMHNQSKGNALKLEITMDTGKKHELWIIMPIEEWVAFKKQGNTYRAQLPVSTGKIVKLEFVGELKKLDIKLEDISFI